MTTNWRSHNGKVDERLRTDTIGGVYSRFELGTSHTGTFDGLYTPRIPSGYMRVWHLEHTNVLHLILFQPACLSTLMPPSFLVIFFEQTTTAVPLDEAITSTATSEGGPQLQSLTYQLFYLVNSTLVRSLGFLIALDQWILSSVDQRATPTTFSR